MLTDASAPLARAAVRRSRQPQRSAAVVAEFALVAPILVFMLLGTFELARGIMIKQLLNDAARKACREGVLPGKTNANVTAQINDILTDNNIPTGDATITIQVGPESALPLVGTSADVSTARAGLDFVSVKIAIPISDVYWISTYFLSSSTVESEMVVMLKQG
jgi:Flp pilus assembly protein TadG